MTSTTDATYTSSHSKTVTRSQSETSTKELVYPPSVPAVITVMVQNAEVASVAVSSVSVVAGASVGGGVLTLQRVAALASFCEPFEEGEGVGVADHPLRFTVGPWRTRAYVGAAMGATSLFIGVCTVLAIAAFGIATWKSRGASSRSVTHEGARDFEGCSEMLEVGSVQGVQPVPGSGSLEVPFLDPPSPGSVARSSSCGPTSDSPSSGTPGYAGEGGTTTNSLEVRNGGAFFTRTAPSSTDAVYGGLQTVRATTIAAAAFTVLSPMAVAPAVTNIVHGHESLERILGAAVLGTVLLVPTVTAVLTWRACRGRVEFALRDRGIVSTAPERNDLGLENARKVPTPDECDDEFVPDDDAFLHVSVRGPNRTSDVDLAAHHRAHSLLTVPPSAHLMLPPDVVRSPAASLPRAHSVLDVSGQTPPQLSNVELILTESDQHSTPHHDEDDVDMDFIDLPPALPLSNGEGFETLDVFEDDVVASAVHLSRGLEQAKAKGQDVEGQASRLSESPKLNLGTTFSFLQQDEDKQHCRSGATSSSTSSSSSSNARAAPGADPSTHADFIISPLVTLSQGPSGVIEMEPIPVVGCLSRAGSSTDSSEELGMVEKDLSFVLGTPNHSAVEKNTKRGDGHAHTSPSPARHRSPSIAFSLPIPARSDTMTREDTASSSNTEKSGGLKRRGVSFSLPVSNDGDRTAVINDEPTSAADGMMTAIDGNSTLLAVPVSADEDAFVAAAVAAKLNAMDRQANAKCHGKQSRGIALRSLSAKGVWSWLWHPVGEWHTSGTAPSGIVNRGRPTRSSSNRKRLRGGEKASVWSHLALFGPLFAAYRQRWSWFLLVEIYSALFLAAVSAASSAEVSWACVVAEALAVAGSVLLTISFLVLRPYATHGDTALAIVSAVLEIVAAGLRLVGADTDVVVGVLLVLACVGIIQVVASAARQVTRATSGFRRRIKHRLFHRKPDPYVDEPVEMCEPKHNSEAASPPVVVTSCTSPKASTSSKDNNSTFSQFSFSGFAAVSPHHDMMSADDRTFSFSFSLNRRESLSFGPDAMRVPEAVVPLDAALCHPPSTAVSDAAGEECVQDVANRKDHQTPLDCERVPEHDDCSEGLAPDTANCNASFDDAADPDEEGEAAPPPMKAHRIQTAQLAELEAMLNQRVL